MAISMHGLDLSFMKTNPLPKPKRKRKPKGPDFSKKRSTLFGGAYVMPDLDAVYNGGFRSPIDDSWISSRKQLRDHNRAHGVIQVGDVKPDQARERNLRKMQYDAAAKSDPNFSWVRPTLR